MNDSTGAAGRPNQRQSAGILWLLCLVHLVIAMDFTIIYVALPAIGEDIGVSDRELTFVTATYGLTFAAFLLLGGRAADLFGRRDTVLIGLVILGVASAIAAIGTMPTLLIGRALQGMAGAILTPGAQAIVTTLYPQGPRRNRALGLWGITGAGGLALGGPVGGALTHAFGWRAVMLVNILIALVSIAAVIALVRRDRPEFTEQPRFNLPSVLAGAGGCGFLVWAVAEASVSSTTITALRMATAVALIIAFILIERYGRDPVIPADLLRQRSVAVADVMALVFGATLGGQFFLITLYLQSVAGFSTLAAGMAFIPVTVFSIFGNMAGSRLISSLRIAKTLVIGFVLAVVAMVLLGFVPSSGSFFSYLLPTMCLLGLGQGIVFVTVTVAAVSTVAEQDQGVASSLLNVGMNVGQSIGPAVLASVVTLGSANALSNGLPELAAHNAGMHAGFRTMAAIALVGLALTALLRSRSTDRSAKTDDVSSESPTQ